MAPPAAMRGLVGTAIVDTLLVLSLSAVRPRAHNLFKLFHVLCAVDTLVPVSISSSSLLLVY
jgi:hypothetical protein